MARATLHAAVLACFTAAASAGDVGTWDRAAAASSIDYSRVRSEPRASLTCAWLKAGQLAFRSMSSYSGDLLDLGLLLIAVRT